MLDFLFNQSEKLSLAQLHQLKSQVSNNFHLLPVVNDRLVPDEEREAKPETATTTKATPKKDDEDEDPAYKSKPGDKADVSTYKNSW